MLKISIIGVESTGKSMLTEQLASYFHAPFVKEYARDYLEVNGSPYEYEDFINISHGQAQREDKAVQNHKDEKYLFLDTDVLVLKIWADVVYGKNESWLDERLNNELADLYLLLSPDIPWVDDGMREYPDLNERERINELYINLLNDLSCNYSLISGSEYSDRFDQAVSSIKRFSDLVLGG
ncbi:MAG TPA: AAA family ATPase [Saprospiraceae bacterium]|nr:AAA family ATPase [Saprospiraceae bacterium]HQW55455.1 AAA family ATPase [Saprospiraceae bacterium]